MSALTFESVCLCQYLFLQEGPFNACVLRSPDSAGALELALHGVASVLPPGSPLWVFGDVRAGVLNAVKALRPLFKLQKPVQELGEVRVVRALRTSAAPTAPLEAWLRSESVEILGRRREWCSMPGLFAGGLVDVMTRHLLDQLQAVDSLPREHPSTPPWSLRGPDCRVLDFACGSGVLAAGVRQLWPEARLVLLDADAVALEAARRNVPGAEEVVLADGLGGLGAAEAAAEPFDLIVSNPPVHRGHADDLSVLMRLISEAPARLRPRGELWLVSQEHVPTGQLFELARKSQPGSALLVTEMVPTADGRFTIWKKARLAEAGARGAGVQQAERRRPERRRREEEQEGEEAPRPRKLGRPASPRGSAEASARGAPEACTATARGAEVPRARGPAAERRGASQPPAGPLRP
ncbi:unnamed protein product, partial [Prorocentrum cordatum]